MTTLNHITRELPGGGAAPRPTLRSVRKSLFNDTYHYLVSAPWPLILLVIAATFCATNVLFALGYMQIGGVANAHPGSFRDAFFFSVQTLATIGYGAMTPRSDAANLLVTLEALTGGIGLALMTGLVFAKFSRPTSRVRFSKLAAIGDLQGRRCLMFRMANERDERIIQPQLYAVMLISEREDTGGYFIRVHDVGLTRDRHAFLSLSWLVIHPIDERSPLAGAGPDSLREGRVELVVSLTGIDESLSQTVHANHTYRAEDIRWNVRFTDILRPHEGDWLVDYARFDEVEQQH